MNMRIAGPFIPKALLSVMATVFLSTASAAEGVHDGSLADGNLRLVGRWDRSDPNEAHGLWTAHYIRMNFTGTTVRVRIAADANLQVILDNKQLQEISGKAGEVDLTPEPLAPGKHTLLLTTRREEDAIRFQGFRLDAQATTAPVRELPLIEFVGDSITANAGDRKDYADFTDTNPFSWRVAEMLGADHVQIAQSGIALVDGGKPGMASQYFKANNSRGGESSLWKVGYAPAIVVVNLGTNDQVEPTTFAATYTTFLRRIRALQPTSELVVMRPFGGSFTDAAQQAAQALTAKGDARVHYVDTSGWLATSDFSDGIHPSNVGSLNAAQRLKPILQVLLKKTLP